jgi:hypothetical protein
MKGWWAGGTATQSGRAKERAVDMNEMGRSLRLMVSTVHGVNTGYSTIYRLPRRLMFRNEKAQKNEKLICVMCNITSFFTGITVMF